MSAERYYEFDAGYETDITPTPSDPSGASDLVNLAYAEAHFARGVADLTALKAIAAARRSDQLPVYVESSKEWFWFDAGSSATGDDVHIITPTAGSGRWYRRNPSTRFTVANNTGPSSVTGLSFDPTKSRGLLALISVYRSASGGQTRAQSTLLQVVYDGTSCYVSEPSSSYAGVDFSATSGGQVQYTSDDNGGSYSSATSYLDFKILEVMPL